MSGKLKKLCWWVFVTIAGVSLSNIAYEFFIYPVLRWIGIGIVNIANAAPIMATEKFYSWVASASIDGGETRSSFLRTSLIFLGSLFLMATGRVRYRRRRLASGGAGLREVREFEVPFIEWFYNTTRLQYHVVTFLAVMMVAYLSLWAVMATATALEARFMFRLQAVSEFMSVQDERSIRSKFARIKGPESYDALMAQLESLASDNGVEVPTLR